MIEAWSSRELLGAALCLPGIEGWSGTVASQESSPNLKLSTFPDVVSLSSCGIMLKSLAPFTLREDSLALLTEAGDWCL